jgi:microcystin degradation protein MlrC
MTIFTGPSSTMITSMICDGSAIEAKRFRTSTRSKRLAARSRAATASTVAASNGMPMRTSARRRTSSSGVAVLPCTWIAAMISAGCTTVPVVCCRAGPGGPVSIIATTIVAHMARAYLMPTLVVTFGTR